MVFDRIVPMAQAHADQIARWRYEGVYSFYNCKSGVWEFDADCFACLDGGGVLTGYFCFGGEARIPTVEEGAYAGDLLDIGLGLRPDLCGRGLGPDFMALGLRFAEEKYGPAGFRLAVAAFNERAVKVYRRLGFQVEREVTNAAFHNKFYLMTRK